MEQGSLGGIQGAFLLSHSLSLPFSFSLYLAIKGLRTSSRTSFAALSVTRNLLLTLSHFSSTLIDEILWHLATCPSSGLNPTKRPPTRHIRVLLCQVRDAFWACALARISREYARTVHHRYCIQTYAKGREILLRLYIYYVALRAQTRVCYIIHEFLLFPLKLP